MKLLKAAGRVLNVGTAGLAGAAVRQLEKPERVARREAAASMGAINAERALIETERKKKQGELASQRNRLALSMARARKNRGGFGFGATAQPSQGSVKATLG